MREQSKPWFGALKAGVLCAALALWVWQAAEGWPADKRTAPAQGSALPVGGPLQGPDSPSLEELKAARSALEKSEALGDSARRIALAQMDQAIRLRALADQAIQSLKELEQTLKGGEQRIQALRNALDRPAEPAEKLLGDTSRMTVQEAEERLRREETALAEAKAALSSWEGRGAKLKEQPQQLHEDMVRAKKRLEEILAELKAAPASPDPPQLAQARRYALMAEQVKVQADILTAEQQLAANDALMALARAERDIAARTSARLEESVAALRALVQLRRQDEALRTRERAERAKAEAIRLPPAVQEQFQINVRLGEVLERLVGMEEGLAQRLKEQQAVLKELEAEFALTQERLQTSVLTSAMIAALREQRRVLPTAGAYRQATADRPERIAEARAAEFEAQRQHKELVDLDGAVNRVLSALGEISRAEGEVYASEIRQLLRERRKILEDLQAGYRRVFRNLQALEFTEQQIVGRGGAFGQFLDSQLLWMRSAGGFDAGKLEGLGAGVRWLGASSHWARVLKDLQASVRGEPLWWLVGLLAAGGLLAARRRTEGRMSRPCGGVAVGGSPGLAQAIQALFLTTTMAAGWPLLLGFVGWRIQQVEAAGDFSRAVSAGLLQMGLWAALLLFLFHAFRPQGLAEAHLGWPRPALRDLRRNLAWFIAPALLLTFLMTLTSNEAGLHLTEPLGRILLVVYLVLLSAVTGKVLGRAAGVSSALMERAPEGWMVRLRPVWYPTAVGLPLMLAVLSLMGYSYTARVLTSRLHQSIWLILALTLAHGLLSRWLQAAGQRLAGARLQTAVAGAAAVGLWLIWRPVLPALSLLGDIRLWSHAVEVDGAVKAVPLTLSDLAGAAILAVVTVIASRHLPGLLETVLEGRVAVDAGLRYAAKALCRYTVIALGTVLTLQTLGLRWSSIQWLVAALGVGVGFGLQELVANFVSGLVVLLERPFRVGDVVTVGEVSGTVTKIHIRATTIMDWDRKELIVPNKEFITGRLTNWSLSDPVTRIVVPVGIAYGSDTALAERLLIQAAEENPLVLKNPAPSALFLAFGEDSLKFELRVFVREVGHRLQVVHELHRAVDAAFRRAGIVMAFPQRDLHLDAKAPLEIRLVPSGRGHEAG